jgi:hypothetical protein
VNDIALVARLRCRVIVAAIAILSLVAAVLGVTTLAEGTEETAVVVAILHPMPPLGNIDCCH